MFESPLAPVARQITTVCGLKFNVVYIKNINYTKNYLTFNKRVDAPSTEYFPVSFCAWSKQTLQQKVYIFILKQLVMLNI